MSEKDLSHLDKDNQPIMVDVGAKGYSLRTAVAESTVVLGKDIMTLLNDGEINSKKGPVFQTAIIAGTMAVKKTSDLIPFCHPLPVESCKIKIEAVDDISVRIESAVSVNYKTGVEMEALTGATVAALTIYDMCKAMSKAIVINETRLISKTGGKSDYAS